LPTAWGTVWPKAEDGAGLALGYGADRGRVQFRRLCIAAVLFKKVAGALNIVRKDFHEVSVEMRPNDDSEAVDLLRIRRHGIGGQNPASLAHFIRNVELVVLFHGLVQRERAHRDALGLIHDLESSALGQAIAKVQRIVHRVFHDTCKAFASQPQ